ncbi:MAG: WecB/TagA/CpsF family glycosyltransferase [Patescibacteria group bacterium]|jgi:N-acetylglucosaminyldiphosphoundecaprenol N-acetyl-beta-D-mannosaminyltransferase
MTSVLGIPIDVLSDTELEDLLLSWMHGTDQKTIMTPNPEMILAAQKNKTFRDQLIRADLHLPDAIGLCLAIRLQGNTMPKRQSGIDTLAHLAKLAQTEQKKILILGGAGDHAKRAAIHLAEDFPGLHVQGLNPGALDLLNGELAISNDVVEKINIFAPHIIALALPQEKQSAFFSRLPLLPSVRITIGVGGAADMLSGDLKRAPRWMRKIGLEWLWRLILEPSRIGRIFNAVIVFPLVVFYDNVTSHK